MSPWFSLCLDALRFLAALGVALAHIDRLSPLLKAFTALPSHFLVVCFFVLSGYLIAHSSAKAKDWRDYFAARASRIYGVLLPALLLTGALLFWGLHCCRGYYRPLAGSPWDLPLCALGLQEFWFSSATPPSNEPLWSLAYECWYYLLFGLFLFLPKTKWRGWMLAGAALLAGPRVLLLFPVWLMGAFWLAALAAAVLAAPKMFIEPLFIMPFCALTCALAGGPHVFYERSLLGNSSHFCYDWIEGALLALALFYLKPSLPKTAPPEALAKPLPKLFRAGAGFSYSLYLTHYPLFLLGRMLPVFFDTALLLWLCDHPLLYAWGYFAAVVAFAWAFSLATEKRRARLAARLKRMCGADDLRA